MDIAAKEDITLLLKKPLAELIAEADSVRSEFAGSRLDVCNIINAKSGLCAEDCKFCAQSARHKTEVAAYPLVNIDTIVKGAKKAKEIGAERFGIVTSGNRLTPFEIAAICRAAADIKSKVGITVCASLGALSREDLAALKEAGVSRYHHNIETSPHFYTNIVSTHSFQERVDTIKAAKSAGLEVCSGGIIGLGESWQDRIDMALLLKELDVDSIPINVLIPIKGTPLQNLSPISASDAVRAIAIFRIILKEKTIKIAAGRESILKDFQAMIFMAGANGMLIGGYLTTKGREVEADLDLIEEIKKAWSQ